MQGRARIAWRGKTACARASTATRRLAAASTCAPAQTLRGAAAGGNKSAVGQGSAPFKWPAPPKLDGLLEGFCPEPRQEEQIAAHCNGRLLIVRLADIDWLEAADNGVALHLGNETHLLRATLTALAAKLPPTRFLHLSPSTLVNIERVRELQPLCHGAFQVLLRNGLRLTLRSGYGENSGRVGFSLSARNRPLSCSRFTWGRADRNQPTRRRATGDRP